MTHPPIFGHNCWLPTQTPLNTTFHYPHPLLDTLLITIDDPPTIPWTQLLMTRPTIFGHNFWLHTHPPLDTNSLDPHTNPWTQLLMTNPLSRGHNYCWPTIPSTKLLITNPPTLQDDVQLIYSIQIQTVTNPFYIVILACLVKKCIPNVMNHNFICNFLNRANHILKFTRYRPTTRSIADWIPVWKRGASADTSHLKMPEDLRSTFSRVTMRSSDDDT